MATVHTLGYQQRHIDNFVEELQRVGIDIVVDVRDVPWSRKPGFSRQRLADSLALIGIDYVHAKYAGNPKAIRDRAQSYDDCLELYSRYLDKHPELLWQLDSLLAELLANGMRPCLICYERHPNDCHRSLLLEAWIAESSKDVEIVHLGTEGAERLSSRGIGRLAACVA